MISDSGPHPPIAYRCMLRLASWIAPTEARAEWLRRWKSRLRSWWILGERGELVGDSSARPIHFCGETFGDALGRRFSDASIYRWVGGPAFLLAGSAAWLLLLAAASHGFAVARSVYQIRSLEGNRVMAYTAPIVAALAIGAVMAVRERLPLKGCGWRYGTFLALKLAAVTAIMPLLWIEGGHAIRACTPNLFLRQMAMGLVLAVVFVAVYCRAVVWSIEDQRRRCPVCLHRFAMPVSMGSWASVFEPASTEYLCDRGHATSPSL